MNETIKEMWDRNAAHFQAIVHEDDDGYPQKLVEFLQEQGALTPGCRVADVGCGTGKYAIRFAKLGCGLLLLDISENMMAYAKENLAEFQVPAETRLCDWSEMELSELGGEASVDLAFAAMTPAIQTHEDLRKLTAMSRRYCFLSRFAGRRDLLLEQTAQALGLQLPKRDHQAASRELVGWLLEDGFLPEVRLVPYGWENLRTVEETCEILLRDDLGETIREAGKTEQMKAYVQTLADETGMVRETVRTTALWVLWEV